jgi:hypothetical protein
MPFPETGVSTHGSRSYPLQKNICVEEIAKIKFTGLWDTVGALGNPLLLNGFLSSRNQFHDTELSSRISNAFHALAIDEKMKNFEATL